MGVIAEMANWYSADLHFSHARIIKFCNRPFKSTAEMNAKMIANFQLVIQPDDDLWIIGDFAFLGGAENVNQLSGYFHSLPGRKHLVVGNHDDESILALPWASVQPYAEIKDGKQDLVLCHYPFITWNGARNGAIHLFGHVHDQWQGATDAVNVGVDMWDFKPVQLDAIRRRGSKLPQNKHRSDVEHGVALD